MHREIMEQEEEESILYKACANLPETLGGRKKQKTKTKTTKPQQNQPGNMKALQGDGHMELQGKSPRRSMLGVCACLEAGQSHGSRKAEPPVYGGDRLKKSWGVLFCLQQGSLFRENHKNGTQEPRREGGGRRGGEPALPELASLLLCFS